MLSQAVAKFLYLRCRDGGTEEYRRVATSGDTHGGERLSEFAPYFQDITDLDRPVRLEARRLAIALRVARRRTFLTYSCRGTAPHPLPISVLNLRLVARLCGGGVETAAPPGVRRRRAGPEEVLFCVSGG